MSSRSGHQPVGMKKTLVFYRGKPPKGSRTDWIMHEYRLINAHSSDPQTKLSAQVKTEPNLQFLSTNRRKWIKFHWFFVNTSCRKIGFSAEYFWKGGTTRTRVMLRRSKMWPPLRVRFSLILWLGRGLIWTYSRLHHPPVQVGSRRSRKTMRRMIMKKAVAAIL